MTCHPPGLFKTALATLTKMSWTRSFEKCFRFRQILSLVMVSIIDLLIKNMYEYRLLLPSTARLPATTVIFA